MFMVFAVFFSEQASLKEYSFIPLPNWHKLINVLLLVEQCSLVLYLGRVSGTLSRDLGEAMFGLNLVLVLVFQEKDSVHGMVGINYSLIPLLINNGYMFYSNCVSLAASRDNIEPPAFMKDHKPTVNRSKVAKSVLWFFVSIAGYLMMARMNQGLNLNSSSEMFIFSIYETVFMVATALNFFYSWQTYSEPASLALDDPHRGKQPEVLSVPLRDILDEMLQDVQAKFRAFYQSRPVQFILGMLAPLISSTEKFTGRGGILTNGFKQSDQSNHDYAMVKKMNYDSGDDDE